MKYVLPISENYVKHWGVWEAVRELIQNAYDERDRNPSCVVEITQLVAGLEIKTSLGKLSKSSLVLGNTDKGDGLRGQFGEGYKLALLVLCRLGFTITIFNESELWIPSIEYNTDFECNVLVVSVSQTMGWGPGVSFVIRGDIDYSLIKSNLIERVGVLSDEPGRIYVGGLYVCTLKDFKNGYSFGVMKLDRDRSLVSEFDVSLAASKLWSDDPSAVALIEEDSADVRYIEHMVQPPLLTRIVDDFVGKHGPAAVPVDCQEDIVKAQASGTKWVLVKSTVRRLLGRVISLFIPSTLTPIERLKLLLDQVHGDVRVELEDIIKVMES